MADLNRIKSNVAKMVDQGAPESDIDTYIEHEGTTVDAVKAFKGDTPKAPEYSKLDAFMAGGGQGATFGASDEIASKIQKGDSGQNLQRNQVMLKNAQEQHPIMYGLGEVAGGVSGAMTGGGLAARALPMLAEPIMGMIGKNAVTKTIGGSAIGGLSGGAYGFNTGTGSGDQRVENAKTGAEIGAAAGPIGAVVGAGAAKVGGSLAERAKALYGKFRPSTANEFITPPNITDIQSVTPKPALGVNEQNKAMGMLSDAIRKDYGPNAEQVMAGLKNGEIALGDIISDKTPNLKGLAVGAAQYPQGRAVTEQAMGVKMADRGTRVADSMSRNIADFGGFHQTMDDIVSKGQEKAKPLYEKAYQNTVTDNSVFLVPEVQDALQRAYKQYPSELAGVAPNSIKALDYAKKALDDDIGKAQRTGEGNYARSRVAIKSQLTKAMDEASPDYAEARKTAGDYLSIKSAMENGKNIFKERPEIVRDTYKSFESDSEKKAYKMGLVEAMRTELDRMPFTSDPYKKIIGTQGNKERLGALLSPDEYRSFEKDLRSEQQLFKLYSDALGNSNTASKLKAAQPFEGAGVIADMVMSGGPKASIVSGVRGAVKKAFDGISDNTSGIIADALFETNPTKKLAIIKKLKPKSGVLNTDENARAMQALSQMETELRKRRTNLEGAVGAAIATTPEGQ